MIRLFLFLVLLIGSIWLGLKIYADPGYALFIYQDWSVEMPLWLAGVAGFIALTLIYTLIRLLGRARHLSTRMQDWSSQRRLLKAQLNTNRGLIQLMEGSWQTAEKYLIRAAKTTDTPLINYLAAARAAQEQSAHDKRDDYLRLAHRCTPEAEVAIGLTQAELQLQHHQLEQALATLRHLYTLVPHHGSVLKLLKKVYYELAEWEALSQLLPNLKKYKLYTKNQLDRLEKLVYQYHLNQLIRNNEHEKVNQLWQCLPKACRHEQLILLDYATYLYQHDQSDHAELLLREQLKYEWEPRLIELYGLLTPSDPSQHLHHAEQWLKYHRQDPVLLLCLGRICKHHQLWGKAEEYLKTSIALKPCVNNHRELADLLQQQGQDQDALTHYREGLHLAELNSRFTTLGDKKQRYLNTSTLF